MVATFKLNLLCGLLSAVQGPVLSAYDDVGEQLFVRRIAPLLNARCLACHGRDESEVGGGLNLRTFETMRKGGESGQPAVVNGKPDESPLFLAVSRNHADWSPMPPKEAEKLTETQLGWIRDWINHGAVWPDSQRSEVIARENAEAWSAEDGVAVATAGGESPEWKNRKYKPEDLWAYQPVRKPSVPAASGGENERNPIDRFIDARIPADLNTAPIADRVALIRRATFDLTGLPPTSEDVRRFVADTQSDADAFATVIDRLLKSPHYGERMAQHWLDVTRYADSSGFANDYERGNAWRYRDYVVRSFSDDKPYDQFVREQIAGDELAPDNPEMLIATGFLRMGPWELTGMEVARIARQRFLDDVTNSVGETFLAHSLQCARCHDHKFDPVPTYDYYAVQAVFATTQISERPAAFLPVENTNGFDERKHLEQRRAEQIAVLAELDAVLLQNAQKWFADHGKNPAAWNTTLEIARQKSSVNAKGFSDVFDSARRTLMKQGLPESDFPPRLVGFTSEQFGRERVAQKGLERLKWEMDRYEPVALSVYDGRTPQVTSINSPFRIPSHAQTEGDLEQTCILTGGDPFSSGQKVQPGVLSVLSGFQKRPVPETIKGRRLAFADWVAQKENPLTTRAIVNRIWLWHFHQPIAGNPNNFGSTGRKPSHPELLDWLAATFVENGWSFKAMHRIIMTSGTYRRSAVHPNPELLKEKDPTGTSYAVFRPRRLSAEEIRDAMLAVTGELNPERGGIPIRPEMNLEAALQPRQVMGTFAAAWTPNPLPEQRHRRSLYALKLRGLPDPAFEVFNAPTPDFSCERRDVSTITPQVFSLFNSQNTHSRSLALAQRAIKETQSDDQAVTRCFQLAFCRQPTEMELQTCLAHWRYTESSLPESTPPPTGLPPEVRRDAVEENTGERFSFVEKLFASAEFVPDLQPGDVSPHTRALADVCLAIFNTNEFAYLY